MVVSSLRLRANGTSKFLSLVNVIGVSGWYIRRRLQKLNHPATFLLRERKKESVYFRFL
jgi:hypothetical protein